MSKHQFDTEISQLLNLMINSLYSNKEIFLRELISNASDAIDKLSYLSISDDKYKSIEFEPKIEIKVDKENKTLSVIDNGIGMNEDDLKNHLGTIAKSGTKAFIDNMSGDAKKDSALIGKFGVGFYASFMVADKIEVTSRKASEDNAYIWTSEAGDSYEIKETSKESFGTEIKLYIKEDMQEFLGDFRLENIVNKFSNHIAYPIYLDKIIPADKDGKEEINSVQVNKANAIWKTNKNELKDEDYIDFYKQSFHDSTSPLSWSHVRAEGKIEYTTLLYVPSVASPDLFRVDFTPGVKLYVKRVFITDDEKELLPLYLRFVKGIIDVEDLPLNVSREILQENVILTKIKDASVKKILTELSKLKNKDLDKYKHFYSQFGKVLKEGLHSDFVNRNKILDLLLLKSTNSDELITLNDYKERMKEDQKEIYYITGSDEAVLKNSPLLEKFISNDIEVLILDDDVDGIVFPMVEKFGDIEIKHVSQEKFQADKEDAKDDVEVTPEFGTFLASLKEFLKDEVKDVKVSSRLSNSAVCLVNDANDPDFQTQAMLKSMGQATMEFKPILEINKNHEIIKGLLQNPQKVSVVAPILIESARLAEGMEVKNSVDFVKNLNKVMVDSL
ncbi:MAG: Chaperone protein HtpG [uncultured Campylobacterales bacterium]|uniref:Chaperone protein HtpG n=1 Tax=uncultured Campylobacterales bacterium TaxID=352960 RepID=A0A6S6T6E7_9BACT|nr:MAG: Chaperone protein HtpG [uncultured Campylobacterales bacterium]